MVMAFCQSPNIKDELLYIDNIKCFYVFDHDKKCFVKLKELDLERQVFKYLMNTTGRNITTAMIKDFISLMKYKIYRTVPDLNFRYTSLNDNKIIDMDTFEIVPFDLSTPPFHHINCSSDEIINSDREVPERFGKYLNEVIVDRDGKPDKEMQKVVQEMVGYYLLSTLEAHVVFFLTGKGRNGKSIMLDVMREIIGEEFTSTLTVEDMTKKDFRLGALVGKKVNLCDEDESSFVKTDKFKALISGSPVEVENKYEKSFSWKPTVKHIFATNEMPSFSGFNKALIERVYIVSFHRFFEKHERDTQLLNKLKGEIGGIISWAIEGAKRLKENNFIFTEAEEVRNNSMGFQQNISGAALFFNENYEVSSTDFIANDDLYESYKIWCDNRGKKKQSYYVFIKDICTLTGLENKLGKVDGSDLVGKNIKRKQLSNKF